MNGKNKVTNTNVDMTDNISVYLVQERRKLTILHLFGSLQKVCDRQLLFVKVCGVTINPPRNRHFADLATTSRF